jgi:hypothetical protein
MKYGIEKTVEKKLIKFQKTCKTIKLFCILRSNSVIMNKYLSLFVIVLIVTLSSCKDDKSEYTPFEPVNNQASHTSDYYNAGLGENPGIPAGTLYSFPTGIEIVGYVHGNAPTVNAAPNIDKTKYPSGIPGFSNLKTNYLSIGYGSLVNLYFSVYNTTGSLMTVIIPKGTICHEANHTPSNQHGLLVKTVSFDVPAHDTTDVHLVLFCVNAHHGIATATDPYKIGVITVNPDLLTVCNILDAKPAIDPNNYGTIQSILWKITDNGGFGQADIDTLNAM